MLDAATAQISPAIRSTTIDGVSALLKSEHMPTKPLIVDSLSIPDLFQRIRYKRKGRSKRRCSFTSGISFSTGHIL